MPSSDGNPRPLAFEFCGSLGEERREAISDGKHDVNLVSPDCVPQERGEPLVVPIASVEDATIRISGGKAPGQCRRTNCGYIHAVPGQTPDRGERMLIPGVSNQNSRGATHAALPPARPR